MNISGESTVNGNSVNSIVVLNAYYEESKEAFNAIDIICSMLAKDATYLIFEVHLQIEVNAYKSKSKF